jgi:hypothetical protein
MCWIFYVSTGHEYSKHKSIYKKTHTSCRIKIETVVVRKSCLSLQKKYILSLVLMMIKNRLFCWTCSSCRMWHSNNRLVYWVQSMCLIMRVYWKPGTEEVQLHTCLISTLDEGGLSALCPICFAPEWKHTALNGPTEQLRSVSEVKNLSKPRNWGHSLLCLLTEVFKYMYIIIGFKPVLSQST